MALTAAIPFGVRYAVMSLLLTLTGGVAMSELLAYHCGTIGVITVYVHIDPVHLSVLLFQAVLPLVL